MGGSIDVSYMSSSYFYKGKQKSRNGEPRGQPQVSLRKASTNNSSSFLSLFFSATGNPKSLSLWQRQPINSSGRKKPIWGNLYSRPSLREVIKVCFVPFLYWPKTLDFGNQYKQNNMVDHYGKIKMRVKRGNSLVELKYLWLMISYKYNSRKSMVMSSAINHYIIHLSFPSLLTPFPLPPPPKYINYSWLFKFLSKFFQHQPHLLSLCF